MSLVIHLYLLIIIGGISIHNNTYAQFNNYKNKYIRILYFIIILSLVFATQKLRETKHITKNLMN